MTVVTRFAPSPTGPLHLGHAYSALMAFDFARKNNGKFLLRIEDIDQSRSRQSWEEQIYQDLTWLGISWDGPVLRQSERFEAYHSGLKMLSEKRLIYPCSCNRKDILSALSAPQEGVEVPFGPDGPIYPGTCRNEQKSDQSIVGGALRINMRKASEPLDYPIYFQEMSFIFGDVSISQNELIEEIGDIVLSRKDMGTSYHLSVILDDAYQGVTDVIRGDDLFEATKIHVLLQKLFGLDTPTYHHHRLIRDANGKRLAKRDDARAISKYREDGYSPSDIRELVKLPAA